MDVFIGLFHVFFALLEEESRFMINEMMYNDRPGNENPLGA